jgi:pantoate--beta-alanine ligase
MNKIETVAEMRALSAGWRAQGKKVALVPTMGALHAGHDALIRRAREIAEVVVVSLFVNPAQFDEATDLAAYPRDEAADAARAEAKGAHVLFAPAPAEVYPPGFATTVSVRGVTEPLEGAARGPAHFGAVATVVLKLLNMAQPDVALFGQKDAQQAAVVRRMVADLDVPVRIETVATVRDADGLALSSRNARLGTDERPRALALSRGLAAARSAVAGGERAPSAVTAEARAAMTALHVEPEYLVLVSPDTFAPAETLDHEVLLAVAARVGDVRLIDNTLLTPNGST